VLWAIVIFGASSVPSDAIPQSIIFSQDKLIHMGVYAVFGILLYRGIRRRSTGTWIAAGWLTFGIGVVYGASDEFHQHFVPGRSMDIFDLIADAIGIACAIGFARYLERRRSRPS
jgi:VanZ family protein